MGFVKRIGQKAKEEITKYQANAPIREKAEIERLKRKKETLSLRTDVARQQSNLRNIRNKEWGMGSGAIGVASIGMNNEPMKSKPRKKKRKKSKKSRKSGKKVMIINY